MKPNYDYQQIKIDPDFHALIPPLSATELEQLEANIVADGCRDPLVVWLRVPVKGEHKCYYDPSVHRDAGKKYGYGAGPCDLHPGDGVWTCQYCNYNPELLEPVLLDGHNRYDICTRRNIKFDTSELVLPDRDAAKVWLITNQFGRRNLSAFARAELALKLEPLLAAKAKENQSVRKGEQPGATPQNSAKLLPVDTRAELAKVSGLSHDTIHKAKVIAQKAPAETQARLRRGDASVHAVYTEIKRKEREEKREDRRQENYQAAESTKDLLSIGAQFSTVLIDPPWDWGDEGDINQLGRAKPDYATIPFPKLLELPVPKLADEDCHLYMWVTNRSLPKGFALLEKWGFRYVTMLTWPKPSFGMGNYFRGQTEHILFGVKGSQMLKRKDAATLLPAWNRGNGHSSKPREFYDFVESCSPGPYLELFARASHDGWESWGADA